MPAAGDGEDVAGRLVFARTPTGEPVAECELAADEAGLLGELAAAAAPAGAVYLWVHCAADLSAAGFAPQHGYRRFTARDIPPGDPLPLLDTEAVLDLLPRAFTGQWGHHQFNAAWAAQPGALYAGLGQPGSWVGLCRIEPERRHLDGPGFPGGPGIPDSVRRLVTGAAAHLGPGPVSIETWGDSPGPYLSLGFSIAEECGGWELALPPPH